MKKLDEVTRKDILGDVDARTADYAKAVKSATYRGVTKDYVIIFDVPSVTSSPATSYECRIDLKEFVAVKDDTELSTQDKVRLSISGDLAVSCTCPAYKWWGYEYIMTQLDSKEGADQTIFPKVRNPQLQGTVCKHLKLAVQVLTFNWSSVAKDISAGKFI